MKPELLGDGRTYRGQAALAEPAIGKRCSECSAFIGKLSGFCATAERLRAEKPGPSLSSSGRRPRKPIVAKPKPHLTFPGRALACRHFGVVP